jgi:hypothetical protein
MSFGLLLAQLPHGMNLQFKRIIRNRQKLAAETLISINSGMCTI